MQWNCNGSIAEEKELVSKQTYTCGTNDKTVNHVEQKSALFGPAMICTNLPHVKGTIPGATECHRNKFQFGYIYYLLMMTDSYAWFQSSASTSQINLVAGLQVFRNQRSSTSAISDSDSSSSTPWDVINPKTPLLRQLEATEAPGLLRACASCQAGSCRQGTDLKKQSEPS